MKTVICDTENSVVVLLSEVADYTPIFVKKDGKLKGMLCYLPVQGWCICTGGSGQAVKPHVSREIVMQRAEAEGYTFHVEQ